MNSQPVIKPLTTRLRYLMEKENEIEGSEKPETVKACPIIVWDDGIVSCDCDKVYKPS